jgi:hypothetical protein
MPRVTFGHLSILIDFPTTIHERSALGDELGLLSGAVAAIEPTTLLPRIFRWRIES